MGPMGSGGGGDGPIGALLALLADPEAAKARITQLQEMSAKAEAASTEASNSAREARAVEKAAAMRIEAAAQAEAKAVDAGNDVARRLEHLSVVKRELDAQEAALRASESAFEEKRTSVEADLERRQNEHGDAVNRAHAALAEREKAVAAKEKKAADALATAETLRLQREKLLSKAQAILNEKE